MGLAFPAALYPLGRASEWIVQGRTSFQDLVGSLRQTLAALPDQRTGKHRGDAMLDFGLSAFAAFFTQSPSFLAYRKAMQKA